MTKNLICEYVCVLQGKNLSPPGKRYWRGVEEVVAFNCGLYYDAAADS